MTNKEKSEKISNLKDGDNVTCKWKDKIITDAKISIHKNGRIFLCSNDIQQGDPVDDKKGYKYSWVIYVPTQNGSFEEQCHKNSVLNLVLVPSTFVITQDEIFSAEYDSESAEMIKRGATRI